MLFNFKSISSLFNKHKLTYLIVSGLFYFSLFFSTSNKVTFLLSLIYLSVLYHFNRNLKFSIFLVLLSLLPFAKGKSLKILILSKQQIKRFALFDIDYYFPVYLSDFYFLLLVYIYIRGIITDGLNIKLKPKKKLIFPTISFILFIIVSLIRTFTNRHSDVVFLSSIQLIRLLVLFLLSANFVLSHKNELKAVTEIIASSLIFQSIWVILQKLNGGYLGKDLEVQLIPGLTGITATENPLQVRATGTFFEPSILGTFLLVNLSILGFVLFKKQISAKKRLIYLISLGLGSVAIILTGSRALYGLSFLTMSFLIIKYKSTIRNRSTQIKAALKNLNFRQRILLASSFLALLAVSLPFFLQRLRSLPTLFTSDGSAQYRIQLNFYAIRLALQNFWGTGLNLSPYQLAVSFTGEKYIFDPAHPHNIFFQILAETGILGLASFFMFIYLIFRPILIKKQKVNRFTIGALFFLICAQVYPIFLNHPEILSFLFLYSGLHLNQTIKYD